MSPRKETTKRDRRPAVKGIRIEDCIFEPAKMQSCAEAKCPGICCTGGVWLNPDEKPRIVRYADAIRRHLPADLQDESEWFEIGKKNEDYPGGREIGTTTIEDPLRPDECRCVFLRDDRACLLQIISQESDLGWPGLKPFYCALYPLYYEDKVLSIDNDTPKLFKGEACRLPTNAPRPVYETYRDEVILVLGEDGYEELCRIAATRRRRSRSNGDGNGR